MAYLIGNALGACGCSYGALLQDYFQYAFAKIAYPTGWWRVVVSGGYTLDGNLDYTLINEIPHPDNPNTRPAYCYRTKELIFWDSDNNVVFKSKMTISKEDGGLEYYNTYGYTTPPDIFYSYCDAISNGEDFLEGTFLPSGIKLQISLSDKWTIQEAADMADALLDNITLLAPNREYVDFYDGRTFKLGYSFEPGLSPDRSQVCTAFYNVTRNNNPLAPIDSIDVVYTYSGTFNVYNFTGELLAAHGFSAYDPLNPGLVAFYSAKSAGKFARSSQITHFQHWSPLNREYQIEFDINTNYAAPGEYLLLPSDVNGIGTAQSRKQLPPSAPGSASSSAAIGDNPNPI